MSHPYADLLNALEGKEKKVNIMVETPVFTKNMEKYGRDAAVLNAYLNERETLKHSGRAGRIIFYGNDLCQLLGWTYERLFEASMKLANKGLCSFTYDGGLKAA